MSINSYMEIAGIKILVVRKPIKNLHLAVLPPTGLVRVTSPITFKDDAIRTMIATRIPWIKKHQNHFLSQPRQTKREFVSGETHYFFGKPYRLEVHLNGNRAVSLKGKKIILQAPIGSPLEKRREIITDWYRQQFYNATRELIAKWTAKIKVSPNYWGIRQMKTRWGTCNTQRGRIIINLELVKKPMPCLEYVIVHELTHLLEKRHNERFRELMTRYFPKWKSIRQELNQSLLSHEEWNHYYPVKV